ASRAREAWRRAGRPAPDTAAGALGGDRIVLRHAPPAQPRSRRTRPPALDLRRRPRTRVPGVLVLLRGTADGGLEQSAWSEGRDRRRDASHCNGSGMSTSSAAAIRICFMLYALCTKRLVRRATRSAP